MLIIAIVFVILLVFVGEKAFVNYIGWGKHDIPTDTKQVATIRLPKEWDFAIQNGRIVVLNEDGEIAARECYSEWAGDDFDLNNDLDDHFLNLENYELVSGGSNSCHIYSITDEFGNKNYALWMGITSSADGGNYNTLLVFERCYDKNIIEKIQKSYKWGGFAEE